MRTVFRFALIALTAGSVATSVATSVSTGAQAAKYKEMAVSNGGTISGKVAMGSA